MWLGHPSSLGPPMLPAKGRPKCFELKSSWRQRRRSKILAVSLKHWNGSGGVPPLLLRCTAVLIHPGGLEPKRLCTKNGPNRYFPLQIALFPTMKWTKTSGLMKRKRH